MNEQGISQKTLSSLTVLFKDRFDILLDFLAKSYPLTFNKIIEQSVALQTKKPVPLLQQLQAGFQKGGMFGLIGTITNKLFKKVDPTKQVDKNLSDLFQTQDEQGKTSYEDSNVKIKSDPVLSASVTEPVTTSQDENKKNKPIDYFKDTIEPIPFKFDGFTDDGETALWNVFPPLFKDIFKDILRGATGVEGAATGGQTGPRSKFQEKGLVGTIMDWFDYGEDFFPGRGGPRRGSKPPKPQTGKGGFFRNLARGAINVGRLPAGSAALGKAGVTGLAGTAAAVAGGEIIGGQIGKAIGSSETVSEALYGSKTAGKEAYEQYGTGITGFLRASWDLGKQIVTNKQAETKFIKQKQEIIQKDKTLDEPTKRKMSIGVQKQLDEQIQYIEQIKNNTSLTKEEKESRVRQINEDVLLLKRRLEVLKPSSTSSVKPPKPPQTQTTTTTAPTTTPPVSQPQTEGTLASITPTQTEKEIFKDLHDSSYDDKSTVDQKKANDLRQAIQKVGTDDKTLLRDTTYNIQYNNQTEQKQIKPDNKQQKIEQPSKEIKPIQTTPVVQTNKDSTESKLSTSKEPVSLKLYNNDNEVLKEFQNMQYKYLLGMKDMLTDTGSQVTPTPLINEQQITPGVTPAPVTRPDITPIQIDKLENLKDVKIPDNANILTNIASNTESTNSTLKNLNGAILKLAQVFNDKLDKSGGKNNLFINGQPQQDTRPSASQVAASNVDPIGVVRRQFGLV
jgi:hypothetical protein